MNALALSVLTIASALSIWGVICWDEANPVERAAAEWVRS